MNKDLLKKYMEIKLGENSFIYLRSAFHYSENCIKVIYEMCGSGDETKVMNINANEYSEWEKVYLRKSKIRKLKERNERL